MYMYIDVMIIIFMYVYTYVCMHVRTYISGIPLRSGGGGEGEEERKEALASSAFEQSKGGKCDALRGGERGEERDGGGGEREEAREEEGRERERARAPARESEKESERERARERARGRKRREAMPSGRWKGGLILASSRAEEGDFLGHKEIETFLAGPFSKAPRDLEVERAEVS
jgi:hypothetical protein